MKKAIASWEQALIAIRRQALRSYPVWVVFLGIAVFVYLMAELAGGLIDGVREFISTIRRMDIRTGDNEMINLFTRQGFERARQEGRWRGKKFINVGATQCK